MTVWKSGTGIATHLLSSERSNIILEVAQLAVTDTMWALALPLGTRRAAHRSTDASVQYAARMSVQVASGTSHQRPLGVVLVAAFLVIDAALSLAANVLDLGSGTRRDLLAEFDGQLSIVIISLVILRLVAAVGLWSGWRRGWLLTMLLVGISLVLDLWLYWNGRPLYLRMAIDVVAALYLNQGAVRAWFEPASTRPASTAGDAPTSEP
jgi:hypothetical protein